MINDNIEIYVVSVGRDTVKLGIKAPREILVYRKEIYDLIAKENQNSVFENTIDIDINELKNIFD